MENNNPFLKVSDIKDLIRHLSDELNKRDDAEVVEFEVDLYWNIMDEELYNPYDEPGGFTMGSLTEDWEFLQKVVMGERQMINYDLYKLACILKFLGKSNIIQRE
ncbi:hypothetical protein EGY05_18090 [Chryseobacterium arthrosphaerae]|uniref:hypothetical protein n=1 Tax=Chryseobacterium arthrosphaerae TaxID=651561 RepID=UPI000F4D8D4B|nr:hypothetical protein [Chryseobacterium arthrosphaerae]AYZ13733.1 hypothetical protein EGY05_18090 [Chryseobacterium arthrosphaerae]